MEANEKMELLKEIDKLVAINDRVEERLDAIMDELDYLNRNQFERCQCRVSRYE